MLTLFGGGGEAGRHSVPSWLKTKGSSWAWLGDKVKIQAWLGRAGLEF